MPFFRSKYVKTLVKLYCTEFRYLNLNDHCGMLHLIIKINEQNKEQEYNETKKKKNIMKMTKKNKVFNASAFNQYTALYSRFVCFLVS